MNKMKEVISDIIHTAAQAALTDDEKVARQGLADIYDAIASVLHVDHRAAKPVAPIIPGCPSLGPKVLPSGFDGVEPAEEKNPFFEFYGLKLQRFGGAGLNAKLIGKRVNVDKSVQVFEIDVKRGNLATGARATVTENGELLFSLVGGKSFAVVEQMAVSALHSLLKRRHDGNNRRKARRAAKRAAAKNGGQA